jgi:hypothetical protein
MDYYYNISAGATINVLSYFFFDSNIYSNAEIGISPGFNELQEAEKMGYNPDSDEDLDHESVLEIALWQSQSTDGTSYNLTEMIGNHTRARRPIRRRQWHIHSSHRCLLHILVCSRYRPNKRDNQHIH